MFGKTKHVGTHFMNLFKNVSFPEPDTLFAYVYVFSFYSVTLFILSLLCMFQSFLWTDITLLFYMIEHNYGDFCNQKQASIKNVNAKLHSSLYGAT